MANNQIGITKYTSQYIDNMSFDPDFNVTSVEVVGEDATAGVLRRVKVGPTGEIEDTNYTLRIYSSGTDTYIAEALAGSSTASAVWRVQKVDSSGNILFADGDTKFNNIADNYLTISYN